MSLLIVISSNKSLQQSNRDEIQLSRRVFGGRQAKWNEFPFYVGLQRPGIDGNFCGGTIIAESWVLTAGHCVVESQNKRSPTYGKVNFKPGEGTVVIGSPNFKSPEAKQYAYKVIKVIPHPQYKPDAGHGAPDNDVALLKVEGNLLQPRGQARPQKANLPSANDAFEGKMAIVVGTGTYFPSKSAESSATLQVAEAQILNRGKCELYEKRLTGESGEIICTKHPYLKSGVCPGDSGGGLTVKDNQGFVVVGIASTAATYPDGTPGCTPGFQPPTGIQASWTKVTAFLPFIQKTVQSG